MKTYEELKNTTDLKVKDWFECSISYPFHADCDWRTNFSVERETEKAVLIRIDVSSCDGEWDGQRNVWVPKSCFESLKEYNRIQEEREARREQAFEEGCKKYNALIEFCKANKIKGVRVGLRAVTLLKKVQEAGLSYNY